MTDHTPLLEDKRMKLKKRWPIWVAIGAFILCGIAIAAYVLIWGQYRVSTTDAYVDGNIIEVFPKVNGIVRTISVNEMDHVVQGQVIATLDRTVFKLQFVEAQSKLASTLRQVQQMFDQIGQLNASLEKTKVYLEQAKLCYMHRKALVDVGGVSKEDYENSLTQVFALEAQVLEIQEQLKTATAQTYNVTPLNHPLVKQAIEQVKLSWLNLRNTTIKAPATGYIAKKSLQVGENVELSQAMLAIVPLNQLWITANFKENQLSKIRIGQPVKIKTDLYKDQVIFNGRILGISPGTGSVFSILPPQNATGNWIKIVQRVPVRIQLEMKQLKNSPLRLGLSTEVYVDVHNQQGAVLTKTQPQQVLYQTHIYDNQLCGVQKVIEKIIQENLSLNHGQ